MFKKLLFYREHDVARASAVAGGSAVLCGDGAADCGDVVEEGCEHMNVIDTLSGASCGELEKEFISLDITSLMAVVGLEKIEISPAVLLALLVDGLHNF